MLPAAQKQIVFIVSPHGDALRLQGLVADHPALAALGRSGALSPAARCTCGQGVADCPFWSNVLAELALLRDLPKSQALADVQLSPPALVGASGALRLLLAAIGSGAVFRLVARLAPFLRPALAAAGMRMVLMDAVLALPAKDIVLDRPLDPVAAKEAWMLRGFAPVRFIVLHARQPAVARSDWPLLRLTLPAAARLDINEQDCIDSPAEVRGRILAFLGVSADAAVPAGDHRLSSV